MLFESVKKEMKNNLNVIDHVQSAYQSKSAQIVQNSNGAIAVYLMFSRR